MSSAEFLAHQAHRIHQLKLHLHSFEACPDWECQRAKAEIARIEAEDERRITGDAPLFNTPGLLV